MDFEGVSMVHSGCLRRTVFGGAFACLALTVGCERGAPDSADGTDARSFLDATTIGTHLDFDSMSSPEEVIETADLVVTGRLVGAGEGVRIAKSLRTEASDRVAHHIAYKVEVDEVVARDSGNPGLGPGSLIDVQIFSSAQADVTELSKSAPDVRMVVALDWFSPDRAMTAPDGRPQEAAYFPYADMLWLEQDGVLYSPYLDTVSDLAPGWHGVNTLDELVAAMATASAADRG